MSKLLYIAFGGSCGAVLRYLVSGAVHRLSGAGFPWGTFVVNLSGSFLIGFLWGVFENVAISPQARVFLFVGVLGAFTTFSTFAFENLQMIREGELTMTALNIVFSNCLGVALAVAGYFGSRWAVGLFR